MYVFTMSVMYIHLHIIELIFEASSVLAHLLSFFVCVLLVLRNDLRFVSAPASFCVRPECGEVAEMIIQPTVLGQTAKASV